MLHRGGLPAPQTQVLIGDEWFWYARVDFAWPAYGSVLEADGLLKYRDPARPDALQREKLRQERLEELGLQVVRGDLAPARRGAAALLRSRPGRIPSCRQPTANCVRYSTD